MFFKNNSSKIESQALNDYFHIKNVHLNKLKLNYIVI